MISLIKRKGFHFGMTTKGELKKNEHSKKAMHLIDF